MVRGMDGIFYHHPQADFLVVVKKAFFKSLLRKKYPKPVFFSGAIRTELIAEEHALLFEHFSIRYVFHGGTTTAKHMEGV